MNSHIFLRWFARVVFIALVLGAALATRRRRPTEIERPQGTWRGVRVP